MPTPFTDLFPLDRFRGLVASLADPGNEAYHAFLADHVHPALATLLQERLSEGRLRPVPNSEGHETRFLSAWNGMVSRHAPDGDPDACMEDVTEFLGHSTVGRWAFHVDEKGEPDVLLAQAEKFHAKLCSAMDAGDISHFEVESQSCTLTGETYRVRFSGWNPTFIQYERGGKVTPMQPGEPASLKSFEVTFPTGELIVADWFRLDGFSEFADAKRPNLGSEKGREEATRAYAEKGFVSVHVSNSSPDVFERDGVLVFGHGEDESVAKVCTDYWGASVIDRALLVEVVAAKVGREAAERAIEDYVAKGSAERLVVEPGTYRLYMTGEKENFPGLFTTDEVDLDGIEPFFVLSPRPLSFDAEPAVRP